MKQRFKPRLVGLLVALLAIGFALTAATPPSAGAWGPPPPPLAQGAQPLGGVPVLAIPMPDANALMVEDVQRAADGLPPRFAQPIAVDVTPAGYGAWERLPDGTMLWRLRIAAPKAVSLNLGFMRYSMPAGARLFLYAPDYSRIVGPFTELDNEEHGQFWSPILAGEELVIEVTVPAARQAQVDLRLTSVNYGYREFGRAPESGACNVDVVCPEGDLWRSEIRSVAVISTGGSTFCTGFLVNNTAQDLKGYFMTANHCGINSGNAASLVTYWNYENSTCRPPGSPASGDPGDGQLNQFNTGSYFRAASSASDFTLVELDDPIPVEYNVYWAGWDRSSADPTSAVAIHHPNTDEKRISFENDATSTTSYLGTSIPGNGTHIRITDWDLGTTEGGSSGSPLFDQNHHVVGQLHGGYAACGNDDSDWYGRFSISWTGGGTASTRLSDWLDPAGTGVTFLGGRDRDMGPDFTLDAVPTTQGVCAPQSAVYTVTVAPQFGFATTVALSAINAPAGTSTNFSVNPVTPPGTSLLTIGNTGAAAGGTYDVDIVGHGATRTHTTTVGLTISTAVPGAPTLTDPANGATGVSRTPTFQWAAGTGVGTYHLQVATDSGFTNIVIDESGIPGTSYAVAVALNTSTTYYWRVTAENACGNAASAAFSFTTVAGPGDCNIGQVPSTVFLDTMEGGVNGWTHSGTGDTWAQSTTRSHSPTHAWFAVDPAAVSDQRLVSPAIALPTDASPLSLKFWQWYEIEESTTTACWDGGILEVSTDAGSTWTQLVSQILVQPYDHTVNASSNPLSGLPAWCADTPSQDWVETIADLSAFAGQTVQLRYRLGSDGSLGYEGWYVDDVQVQACTAAEEHLLYLPLAYLNATGAGR